MKVGVLCNVCFAGVMLALTGPLFRLFFNASDEIIRLAYTIMAIDIFVEAGRAMNNVEDNALRASGDVVFQASVAMGGCWMFSVLFSFIFVKLGLGLYGVWIAFAMDECGRALIYLARWRSKKWTTKRIIKDESAKAA